MTEYHRVLVTAPEGPQTRLSSAFPAEDHTPDNPSDIIELIADPERVNSFIETTGEQEGWAQWVSEVSATSIADASTLPDALQALVDEGRARVWDYAHDLIPTNVEISDCIWADRVKFTWADPVGSTRNAEPATIDAISTWVEDEYFILDRADANPTQDMDFGCSSGPVFDWATQLERDHPDAELRVTGSLHAPRTFAPHGYAYLDGLAITMSDDTPLTDGVIDWVESRFWGEFNETADTYAGGPEYIGRARECDIYEYEDGEWVRLWWD